MQNMQQEDNSSSPFVPLITWNDDDWNVMVAIRNQTPTVAPPEEAAAGGFSYTAQSSPPAPSPQTLISTAPATIICRDIASIPPGRQSTAILQCGICMDPHLYARKANLKRHMETHLPATHFCHVTGCSRGPGNGFKRIDKLHEHLNKMHGLRQN
ncbi:hypothetical protein CKM354_000788500 [Cercospora kikuchii]|uniref:C2H2-type domain-containing protein n=1 Tax=Cercospora kikuchii TaxID=84275 RepID=A0A9P3CHV9_9PEZI|nr:uncharacterized protein CKM354_000788500 [Cercospora kikuchii]GIZ44694.1 hypothetical protein CKM354_000788500 [Cercospora kikuchii]